MIGPFHDPCCYRVTDETSITPYDSEHGFTANHHRLMDGARPMSGKVFKEDVQKPVWDDCEVIKTVVDHIVGGWRRPYEFNCHSEWISTTANHEWAIWETVRRLASRQVSCVSMASVTKRMTYSPAYRGARMVGVEATPYLRARGYDDDDTCVRFAELSSEFLWYGRIFPKDIVKIEHWTLDKPGDSLPEAFLKPKKHRRSSRWIDNLIWDHAEDSSAVASDKIIDRWIQIRKSRGEDCNGSLTELLRGGY